MSPDEPEDLREFEPALVDGLAGAYYYEEDSFLQPDKLNTSWAGWLGQRGVRFIEDCRLEQIGISERRIHDIVTSQGPMSADHYVFAIGAWSSPAKATRSRCPGRTSCRPTRCSSPSTVSASRPSTRVIALRR